MSIATPIVFVSAFPSLILHFLTVLLMTPPFLRSQLVMHRLDPRTLARRRVARFVEGTRTNTKGVTVCGCIQLLTSEARSTQSRVIRDSRLVTFMFDVSCLQEADVRAVVWVWSLGWVIHDSRFTTRFSFRTIRDSRHERERRTGQQTTNDERERSLACVERGF